MSMELHLHNSVVDIKLIKVPSMDQVYLFQIIYKRINLLINILALKTFILQLSMFCLFKMIVKIHFSI